MERYEKYKDSGVEWIGEIPEGWEIVPIKYSLEIPITDGPHETPEILNEGIPFLSAEAVKKDKLDFNKKRGYIAILDHERFSLKYKPQRGDVYMVKSGATTGNIAKVETDEEFSIWSPLAALRPKLDVMLTDFLFFFMKSKPFFYSVELGWNYGTQQNIGMGVISNLLMTRPPVSEQSTIANYLDRKTVEIDQLIAQKEDLLRLYEEEKTAMINQAVTQGINPDVKLKDSIDWLGEIPEHWEVRKLKYVSYFQRGIDLPTTSFKKGEIPVYGSNGIIGFHNVSSTQAPSITIGRSGSVGEVNFITTDYWAHNTALFLLDNFGNNVTYLYYLLKTLDLKSYSSGTAVGTLNRNNIHLIKVGIPPTIEQTAIIQHIETETTRINTLITKTKKIISLQKEYRSALISEVVTGKIKVTPEMAS